MRSQIARDYQFGVDNYRMYPLPNGACIFRQDLKSIVTCARCSTKDEFGNMFSSQEIMNPLGFGYAVCKQCNHDEIERRCDKNG